MSTTSSDKGKLAMEGALKWEFPILLYDEKCELCKRFKLSLDRVDPQSSITKISLYNPEVYTEFPFLSQEQCLEELHIITGPQTFLTGSQALEYLIKLHPNVKKFSWLIESNSGKKSLNFFYKAANKYRESLRKRCPNCKTIKSH